MYLRYWRITGKLLAGSHEPLDRPGASAGSAHHHVLRVSTLQGNR